MVLHAALPASEDINRSPSFTLGTALLWLGHTCPGYCPPTVTDRRADIWFLHLPAHMVAGWTDTLVDVDFGVGHWPGEQRRELMGRVNHCVWADHIRVRERTAIERATFLAALVARRGAWAHRQLMDAPRAHNLPVVTIAS